MSLSTAMKTAQSSFSNTALQTAVASKNIANASNATYSRRAAILATAANGAAVVEIQRSQNEALQKTNLISISQSYAQDNLLGGLERMKTMFGGDGYELSVSTYLSKLRDNLETFANKPNEASLAETVVANATDVANTLNSNTKAIQQMRADADADIAASVTELNRLLAEFTTYNDKIKAGTAAGTDVNDSLDQRDKLLTEISAIVGVTSITRTNNDMVLYTNDGTVLFETYPRSVTFAPTATYTAGTPGNKVYIDGVEVQAGKGGNTTATGSLAALLQIRDDVAPTFQRQLDETARGLITMFEDAGAPGLFTWVDGAGVEQTTIPGTLTSGLAGMIIVNPDVVTAKGGNPMLIRDGINANQNPDGNAGYSALLNSYLGKFDEKITFDSSTGLDTSLSILGIASASVGWVEQLRSSATTAADDKAALWSRTEEALFSVTAVSLDEELSLLLDLEQSYKASAKLVAAIDEMMTALMNAAG